MVLRQAAALAMVGVGLCASGGWAQTHKVDKPEAVVRAVGVYEWTGDLLKPQASRLIPVSLYINGALEDAAVYQPRPIPFALQPGNAYELQQAGVAKGLLELSSAGKLGATSGFDDGWFGYGTFKPEAEVKRAAALRVAKHIDPITTGKDDNTYGKGSAKDTETANKVDPDRPTLRRRGASGSPDKKADKKASEPDPTPAGTPADDPDRPVLKKRGGKEASPGSTEPASEGATGSLNSDPDRPNLHRGKPSGGLRSDELAMSKLAGLPAELHQLIAVSDAANRSEHDFVRPWEDEVEHKAVLVKMQSLAAAKLGDAGASATGGGDTAILETRASSKASAGNGPVSSTRAAAAQTPAARRRAAMAAAAAKRKTSAAARPGLLDEDLRGFTLSYGGAPTFVYSAHTPGTGDALRYVTVVAQQDAFTQLQVAFSSVTDAAHLDRTPWTRLVGVVDAEASNRASLLFELREQGSRQFALYRVLGSRSEAVFTTGTTQ